MPAAPRAASRGPSMVCGPCRLRRVTMLACAPAASQAIRSMATVIASDVFGLTTRMVGLSICDPPVEFLRLPLPVGEETKWLFPQYLPRQYRVLYAVLDHDLAIDDDIVNPIRELMRLLKGCPVTYRRRIKNRDVRRFPCSQHAPVIEPELGG